MSAYRRCNSCNKDWYDGSDICPYCGEQYSEQVFVRYSGPRYRSLCTHNNTKQVNRIVCDPATITICIDCGSNV